MPASRKIHFIANGIWSTGVAGGDMVFFNLAHAAARTGCDVNFFGGHAFKQVAASQKLQGSVTFTDDGPMSKIPRGLRGQIRLFLHFAAKYRRTLGLLKMIAPADIVCAASDYWFDVMPAVRSPARHKLMLLSMEAPSLREVILRSRPDVDAMRVASLHHWAGQMWCLRQFAKCPSKRVFYLHPLMEPFLDRLGIGAGERTWVSCGIDVNRAEAVPSQTKLYDVVWIGRVHRQKGIGDLLATFDFLASRLENFRALIIGDVSGELKPEIQKRGLANCVEFAGFVSDPAEKFKLFKKSRLFLMPSHYESWGIVIAEALVSNVPVVAYDLPCYRPIFGDLVRYAPPFDLESLKRLAEEEIRKVRAGKCSLDEAALAEFKYRTTWLAVQERFASAVL